MILVKPDLSFRGNLLIHPFLSFRIFALKKCGPNSAGFSMCKNRDASVSTRIFVETSPISPPQSLALIFMCVFSLWGTIRHIIYVFAKHGVWISTISISGIFTNPPGNGTIPLPIPLPIRISLRYGNFYGKLTIFGGPIIQVNWQIWPPLRSSMPVPKRQNGNKPCRSSAASDHRMDYRWMWRNTPRCSMLVEEAGVFVVCRFFLNLGGLKIM